MALIAMVTVASTGAWTEGDVTANVVIRWNSAALQGVRDGTLGCPWRIDILGDFGGNRAGTAEASHGCGTHLI
jgi:hypothetical protein